MQVSYLLATGNLLSRSGLDLMQVSGYTVLAERLNFFRFVSHFQSVHRGAFFSEMKTTTVRKLLPESFGFLCPVHTPDGAPCGLLNHLAAAASVLTSPPEQPLSPDLLISLGVTPSGTGSADGGHVMPKVPPHTQLSDAPVTSTYGLRSPWRRAMAYAFVKPLPSHGWQLT